MIEIATVIADLCFLQKEGQREHQCLLASAELPSYILFLLRRRIVVANRSPVDHCIFAKSRGRICSARCCAKANQIITAVLAWAKDHLPGQQGSKRLLQKIGSDVRDIAADKNCSFSATGKGVVKAECILWPRSPSAWTIQSSDPSQSVIWALLPPL